jgi:hypothetical protein
MLLLEKKNDASTERGRRVLVVCCYLGIWMAPLAFAQEARPQSFFQPSLSYSTTRDPDVPRYAHPGDHPLWDWAQAPSWLDLGLDYRMRFEYRDDDIRRDVAGLDMPFLHRTRAYAGVRDVIDPLRFAVEMQDSRRNNGKFPRDNRDFNQNEIIRLQAELYFADWLEPDDYGNERPVSLRYGIQNFEFLDRRLIGNNQWRNTANTFLGFRAAVGQDANDWNIDVLAVQPLERKISSRDQPAEGQWLYGLIGHWRGWEGVTLEPFYLALDQAVTAEAERRIVHSPGLRIYGWFGQSGFDYDASLIRQFGNSGHESIDAWAATCEIGFRFAHPWQPRLSVFYGYASGDKDPNDQTDHRFERFYGFGRPWSANDSIVFENISTPKLRLEFQPHNDLRVDLGYSWYDLASETDRFAGAGDARDMTGESGSAIGHEFDIRARWQLTDDWEAILGYAHFTAGSFTRRAIRPNDTDFAYLELNLRLF